MTLRQHIIIPFVLGKALIFSRSHKKKFRAFAIASIYNRLDNC